MTVLSYDLIPEDKLPTPLGVIVLQADETLEPEFKRHFSDPKTALYVTRIPSAPEVTTDTLAAMEAHLSGAADLLPKSHVFPVVGYGCTSASSVIGSERVEILVRRSCNARAVTNPLRAAITYAGHLGVSKLALLSPYIEQVNTPLRAALLRAGLSTDVFGTFAESQEARVARIAPESIVKAAETLGRDPTVQAVFLSCTNLKTIDILSFLEDRIGKPVFSSNSALAWHMKKLSGQDI